MKLQPILGFLPNSRFHLPPKKTSLPNKGKGGSYYKKNFVLLLNHSNGVHLLILSYNNVVNTRWVTLSEELS